MFSTSCHQEAIQTKTVLSRYLQETYRNEHFKRKPIPYGGKENKASTLDIK